MQNLQTLSVNPPSLPKAGGALRGIGESLPDGGPAGMAALTVPLPVTSVRGLSPSLALSYGSSTGNGVFGLGWSCDLMAVSRRTSKGVPAYTEEDQFIGPMGEVLYRIPDKNDAPYSRVTKTFMNVTLPESWQVSRYQPRVVREFTRLEYWQPEQGNDGVPFWILFGSDGMIHVLGKTAQARIAHPDNEQHVAQWLLEETVSPSGEHICYVYREEDDSGCDETEMSQHPSASAQRYLSQVNYGNITPQAYPFVMDDFATVDTDKEWLFHLVFDFGERTLAPETPPAYAPSAEKWPVRPDSFSRYEYGFEIRTRRLCRQVLMFHRLKALSGEAVASETPALISRLLLDYTPGNSATLLSKVHLYAYENDGTLVGHPPLDLNYGSFQPTEKTEWTAVPALEKYNLLQNYQLIDLYGDGLPGVLYQDPAGAWWYRQPERDTEADDPEAVAYNNLRLLKQIPSLKSGSLADLNGDGKLDWLVTSAGVNGYHTLGPDQQWSPFIPLRALPTEYFHPQAQLADLTGDGLVDLVLIGPDSVRLYAGEADGWSKAKEIQSGDVTLPVPGVDARKLVAFADMPGSGQAHLAEISADGVRYWPNLGQGRFGQPVTMEGFTQDAATFDPDRVSLADMDGSGSTDIIYACSDALLLYLNESGNRFAEPIRIPLPDGVRFDRTCHLNIADTQGRGVTDIILTVPHMSPSHWRLELAATKPWLLRTINNNMGANTTLFYRSSAQFWLDEKLNAQRQGKNAISHMPFPLHLLWRTETLDEISGNRLTSVNEYAHGVWDGREREFRGFGRVTQTDTDEFAKGSSNADAKGYPARRVSWYATGMKEIDEKLPEEYWQGDDKAWPLFTPFFSRYDMDSKQDVSITPDEADAYWLYRAMNGQPLRLEIYGDDGTEQAKQPYTVSDYRIQVRSLPVLKGESAAAWVTAIESRNYVYERVTVDPQCNQQILLASDEWGNPTDSVSVYYPRRLKPAQSPWPDTLPETLFDSSYDDQQQVLRLQRQRQTWLQFLDNDTFITGLPLLSRTDIWEYPDEPVTQALTRENVGERFTGDITPVYGGHERVAWMGEENKPAWPPRVAYTESAELDEASLTAFDDVIPDNELPELLTSAGYIAVTPPLSLTADNEPDVWVARRGYVYYGDETQFYRPLAQQETLLTGKTLFTWDKHTCVVTEVEDAAGNHIIAEYDYRFLVPTLITDVNNNKHRVTLDALGRVTSTRFWGTENGEPAGYTPPEEEKEPFKIPATVSEALAQTAGIPVAQFAVYNPSAWMAEPDRRQPPHTIVITTDRYDDDPEQQLQQTVTFSDGFGRVLQNAVRFEAGEAWQRAEDGSLVTDSEGAPATAETDTRWAVSGRTEYDSKGQVVRQYQPYFLNSWEYVSDDSARQDLYADTYYYDPVGREYQVITAMGWLRRKLYTPWFTVDEDENDTLEESSGQEEQNTD